MNISIKKRIYWSFSFLVSLFVVNGIITLFTIHSNKKLATNIFKVIEPSLQSLDDCNKLLLESKMYTTNWVFLRASEEDKKSLNKLHDSDYGELKSRMNVYAEQWDRNWADSLRRICTGMEGLLLIEKDIMSSLESFKDYDDPVIKLEAERKVEGEILPRTAALVNDLNAIRAYVVRTRSEEITMLARSSMMLRILIIVLTITIIVAGFLLSIYMTKVIITPVNRIRHIINSMGKGIIQKISYPAKDDEIGKMVLSVNNLSERLGATAAFANEVGHRNFDIDFKPLSDDDSLGKALIAMRDNIKSGDEKLNEAQHIARLGSWERNIETDQVTLADEMFNIFDFDPLSFDYRFQTILERIHPDDIKNVMAAIEKNHYRVPAPIECRIVTTKGIIKDILVDTKVRLGKYGKVETTFGIVQDITERKKTEAILAIKNIELERKNKELEQFVYIASHDLQEPLRTTSSFVELLQKQYHGKIDAKADKYLTYISESSDRMKVLINDLLDYSRIGGKKHLQQVDCNIILQEVIADLTQTIRAKQAELSVAQLPVIEGYRTEIKQLFQNLIINAIKFSKKDTPPRVSITVSEGMADWTFAVRDNGIGIGEDHRDRIFTIFQRLHTRNEYEGSGIGLAHCRKIAGLHNGKIWVESAPGGGSIFYFTIARNCSATKKSIPVRGNKTITTQEMKYVQ